MSVSASWAATCTVVETLPNNTSSAPDATRKVTHTEFNEGSTLTATTTPPATTVAEFIATLTAGALTIDLTALTGTNGVTVNGTGLKVQVVRIKNLGANIMTFKVGAANGHTGVFAATNGQPVQPGAVFMLYTNDTNDDVDGTHKTWDVTGTGSQTAEITIVLG